MPREFSRPQRVADFLRRELATLIQFEMQDPRVGMVSVSDVEVSRDLNYAKVFVTVLGKETKEEAQETVDALNNAAGFLRTRVSQEVQMRTTPRLTFYYDTSISRGSHLSGLINQAIKADEQNKPDNASDDESGEDTNSDER